MKVKKCPFCGEDFEIVIVDKNEKIRTEEGYEDNPVDGLYFGITHNVKPFSYCPIATVRGELVGSVMYDFERHAVNAINKRAEK